MRHSLFKHDGRAARSLAGEHMAMTSGVTYALVSAALFGLSTPLAKVLLGSMPPLVLAGLLYLGSGVGLMALLALRRMFPHAETVIAWPRRNEWLWLAGAIVCGGVAGPVLLMYGLAATQASTASLLLNLEGVFTALLAWFLFHENFDRRIAMGMAAIVAGGVVLSFGGGNGFGLSTGPLLIAAACLCWALDNNLTRRVSASDALVISGLKGVVAAVVNLGLASLVLQYALPPLPVAAAAGVLGFLGYGVSLVLFVLALRNLGTARAGAYFSVAPFFGALVAIALLGDAFTWQVALAGSLMLAGVWLHLTEHHEHEHAHSMQTHVHEHRHDEHHQHAHDGDRHGDEPHTHLHSHAPLRHSHPHYPEVHHRHEH